MIKNSFVSKKKFYGEMGIWLMGKRKSMCE